MRAMPPTRLLLTASVCIGAVLSTTVILGRQSRPDRKPKPAPVIPITVTGFDNGPMTDEERAAWMYRSPAQLARDMENVIASYGLDQVKVQVVGNMVTVSTTANLYDTHPETRFLWSLKVSDEKGKTTFVNKLYSDQIFSIEPRRPATPTFEDTVQLQPGTYTIAVLMYALPQGFDVAALNDEAARQARRPVGKAAKITVPGAQNARRR